MIIKHTFRAYAALFRIHVAEGLQYRTAMLSGAFVSIFWGYIECVLYTVFYTYSLNGSWNSNGFSLSDAISYVWLAQSIFIFQIMSIDGDIMSSITNGNVGIELCRPIDLYSYWFVKSASGKLGTAWIRSIVTLLAGLLMPSGYALGKPSSMAGFLYFLLSLILAFILCSSFGMFVTVIRLNISWGNGPTSILMLISSILSGSYIPLKLWPDFMQPYIYLQPFAGFTDTPAQLYVGSLSPSEAFPGICIQFAWILIFVVFGRAILKKRIKKIIIQGG